MEAEHGDDAKLQQQSSQNNLQPASAELHDIGTQEKQED